MSGQGTLASLPPAGHARPEVLSGDGLVVHHYNRHGLIKDYDFGELPVAEPVARALAALFAAFCVPHRWAAHETSMKHYSALRIFARFVAGLEAPINRLEDLTATHVKRWRLAYGGANPSGYRKVVKVLRGLEYFQAGPVADELAKRVAQPASKIQSFPQSDFDRIKLVAEREFRSALLRIRANAAHLQRWRDGGFTAGSGDFLVGEALDLLVRTGDVPRYANGRGSGLVLNDRYRAALGGVGPTQTWGRLFLTSNEAVSLGVLLLAAFGWNLSVIDNAEVPKASPDQGSDGRPVYRIPVEKFRRGPRLHFETRNVADDGAGSKGRLITEALEATRFARALVEQSAPGTDLLVVWRTANQRSYALYQSSLDRQQPVGPFHFGVSTPLAKKWAKTHGLGGSPFQRGRRTVLVIDKREPAQHSQDVHDSRYALVDRRVQSSAAEVIAAGATEAADRARRAVLVAKLVPEAMPGDAPTAIADCHDAATGPEPDPVGGCGASFLMCLGCGNAHVHPGHHPRLAHLHKALTQLGSVLPPGVWDADWADAHARLDDLRDKVGDAAWSQAQAQVSAADTEMISLLLAGDLNP